MGLFFVGSYSADVGQQPMAGFLEIYQSTHLLTNERKSPTNSVNIKHHLKIESKLCSLADYVFIMQK